MAGNGVNDSFVQQELYHDKPIVRVGLWMDGQWLEGVSMLNGGGFEPAVLNATKQAFGFPEEECWRLLRVDVYPGMIDLFACCKESYPMYSGVSIVVLTPQGEEVVSEYRADCSWPNRSLWVAMAFAKIIREYHAAKGVEAKPSRP
ncbi:MAG: hypothetical protein ABH810_03675 [bacterium]